MRTKSKGFTLIELVVVIAVLGILAGIAIPRFMNASASARGSRILGDLRTIDSAITIYHVQTGGYPADIGALTDTTDNKTGKALLAAEPVPPSGKFTVVKTDGKTGEYETNDNDNNYTIEDGRAKYASKTSEGASTGKQPVEWYLSGTGVAGGTSGTMGSNMGDIINILKDQTQTTMDSGAIGVNGSSSDNAIKDLLEKGFDLKALGAESWHYEGGMLYWAPVDISDAVGAKVPVIRYNSNTGTYTVWIATVTSKKVNNINATGTNETYNVLGNYTEYKPSTSQNKVDQTYENALKYYDDAVNGK